MGEKMVNIEVVVIKWVLRGDLQYVEFRLLSPNSFCRQSPPDHIYIYVGALNHFQLIGPITLKTVQQEIGEKK